MTGYSAADLLDQLMGPNRNLAPGEKPKQMLEWSDPRICKNFLCGFCPYELFTNTKADLGNCPLLHEDKLRNDYEASEQYGKLGYEETFFAFISKILSDCERKISRGYERLKNRRPVFLDPADQESYDRISEKMNAMLKKIEDMGTKGSVEEATYAMQDVEEMKSELNLIALRSTPTSRFGYDREMEVCAVCGSLTLVNDLPSRFEDHLNGRQHVGYSKIRTQDNKYWKKRIVEEDDKDIRSKRRSRSRERKPSSKSEKTKKSRSRSRERRDRDRDRGREKERDRDRGDRGDRDRKYSDRDDRKKSRSPRKSSTRDRDYDRGRRDRR